MAAQLIAALVGVPAILVANMFWVDSRTREASSRDGGSLVDTGIEFANVRAEGNGPPILLIHGFGAAIDWWDDIAPALAAHHNVIRIDLIGHGGTAAPTTGYEITRQAQLASAVLDKLAVDRVTLIGHSMGGEVATALACLNPERIERMILIDSPPIVGTDFTLLTEAYFTPVIGEAMSRFRTNGAMRQSLSQGFGPNFAIPDKFVADLNQLTYSACRRAHDESVAYRTAKPTYQRLAELKPVPPLLAIFGSLDAIVPPANAKLYERVPGATVVMIDGVGHSPMIEAPAETLKHIEAFIK